MSEKNIKKSVKTQKSGKTLKSRQNSIPQYQRKTDSSNAATKTDLPNKSTSTTKTKNQRKAQQNAQVISLSSANIDKKNNVEIQITNVENGKYPTLPRNMNLSLGNNNKNKDLINIQFQSQPKYERSNSFSLTRKLSKIFSSFTGSKENLRSNISNDSNDSFDELPYKFTRSRSMILIRKPKRSVIEQPKLEQLCEEIERNEKSVIRNDEQDYDKNEMEQNQNVEYEKRDSIQAKKRSSIIISTLKRTFSNSSERKKEMNPRWSASLHSLQEVDNMISYDNLSFIDYDKLGSYEKFLEQSLSCRDLTKSISSISNNVNLQNVEPSSPVSVAPASTVVPNIVRRRSRGNTHLRNRSISSNFTFDANIDLNFDKPKNLYRQSLDSEKLKHMNDVQRESFRLSNSFEPLFLKGFDFSNDFNHDCQTGIKKCLSLDSTVSLTFKNDNKQNPVDVVDAPSSAKLKSKSLTHLDTLDSMVACHKQSPTTSQNQKVSSTEYFSIYFYTEAGYQEEELIPATKGVTLSDALSNALKRRNLSFSQITISDNIFPNCATDTESPPYTSTLDENTDVENLAGKLLIITEKDGNKKYGTLQKAASFGSRTRPPRLLSSASTEETIESEQKQVPGKQLKQRWSGLFGIKNPQQNQLCELLNSYAKNGVPQKTSSVNFDHPDFDLALEYLDNVHKSWKDFVCCNDMTDTDIKIQSAIWELVTTEVDYIHALQTVTDLFLACLEAIQDEKLLIDVDQNKLFSNIRDICEANLKFWTYYLYPMVANSITTKQPMCIDYFQPGFVTFATTFAPYKKYCAEQSTCQFYCKELNRNNALFTAYLAWCESQKMCNRLRLADILVRPMQRLTKYSLLLSAIRKHITDENDGDIMDSMIHSVESFVYSVNTHLTTRQENERLKGIMARIESYDIVDSNNEQLDKLIKQYCTMLDLCAPMKGCLTNQGRHLFMEGDLKLKDNLGKADVHCFLLTDILLICKTIAKKGQGTLKVIRQPYLTDKLMVKHKDNTLYCVYLNEFQMVITAFTLQCSEAKCWHDSITKAKHIYSRLKQGSNWESCNLRYGSNNAVANNNNIDNTLGVKKSPLNSSIGSRVSSLNNSHSGSVELNDSRNISVDFEKTNSLSSDEGSNPPQKPKTLTSPHKLKATFSNTLTVQPINHLGQSLPNLNLHPSQASNLYHTYSNNTLLVPGNTHSGNILLSPSHRGISYPPPSPTRATLRRGFAFSSSIKNPPLVKTRNITSQSSINWQQTSATPSVSSSPQSGYHHPHQQQQQQQQQQTSQAPPLSQQQQQQQQQQFPSTSSSTSQVATGLQINETDV